MLDRRSKRFFYVISFIILFITEVIIALYVHDSFVRPYIGDVLVVFVIYCFIRIIIPYRLKLLPFYVFLFSVFTEVMQYFQIVKILGLEHNRILRIMIGSTFDWADMICYGVGCFLLLLFEISIKRQQNL